MRHSARPECIGDEVPSAETDSGRSGLPGLMRSILSPFRAGVVKAPKVGEFGSDGGGCAFWMSLSLSLILSLVWMGWYNRIRTGSNADFSYQVLLLS